MAAPRGWSGGATTSRPSEGSTSPPSARCEELTEVTVLPIRRRGDGSEGANGARSVGPRRSVDPSVDRCSSCCRVRHHRASQESRWAPTPTRCPRAWSEAAASPRGRPAAGRRRARTRGDPGAARGVAAAYGRAFRGSRCATTRPTSSSASSRRRRSTGTSTGCARSCRRSADPHPLRQRGPARAAGRAAGGGRPRGAARATLAIGALDGGFVMPSLRVLTDHEIFRRARRLRRAAALPAGRAVGRDRGARRRRLRGASRSRHRDLSRHPDDHGRGVHPRGGDRRIRGRRPAQRAALPAGPARALPRRG